MSDQETMDKAAKGMHSLHMDEHEFGRTWFLCYFSRYFTVGNEGLIDEATLDRSRYPFISSMYGWLKIKQDKGEHLNDSVFSLFLDTAGCPDSPTSKGLWVWDGVPKRVKYGDMLDFSKGEWRRPSLPELENARVGKNPFEFMNWIFDISADIHSPLLLQGWARYGITERGKIINPLAPLCARCSTYHNGKCKPGEESAKDIYGESLLCRTVRSALLMIAREKAASIRLDVGSESMKLPEGSDDWTEEQRKRYFGTK